MKDDWSSIFILKGVNKWKNNILRLKINFARLRWQPALTGGGNNCPGVKAADLAKWKNQAEKLGKNCKFIGAQLTQKEYTTKQKVS